MSFVLFHFTSTRRSGIFNDPACINDFVSGFGWVVVVGYGTEVSPTGVSTNYWILRNSLGASWGENGYMRMIRGVDMCAIAYIQNFYYPKLG